MGSLNVILQPAGTNRWLVSIDVDSHPLAWSETALDALCRLACIDAASVSGGVSWLLEVKSSADWKKLGSAVGNVVCRFNKSLSRNDMKIEKITI